MTTFYLFAVLQIFGATGPGAVRGQTSPVRMEATAPPINTYSDITLGVTAKHTVVITCWSASPDISHFNIFRSTTKGGPYALIGLEPSCGPTFTDTGVSTGKTYYYVLTTVLPDGRESEYSNEVSITTF